MVLLRLVVRVLRDSSGFGLARSIETSDRQHDPFATTAQPNSTSFLLLLEKPEEVTLGELAGLILEEWRVLRPKQPLPTIKKLVDDTCPEVDLKVTSTVADVFVDRGKAEADGCDQRGTVRVIQKPSANFPERFPSVVQDWDGAIRDAKRGKPKKPVTRFSPIQEDDELLNGWNLSPVPHEYDITTGHNHTNPTAPSSIAIAGTPPLTRFGSEELGDTPSPGGRGSTPHPPFGPELFRHDSVERLGKEKEPTPGSFSQRAPSNTSERSSDKRRRSLEQGPPIRQTRKELSAGAGESLKPAVVINQSHPPLLASENASRKRKQTPEQDAPVKQARVESDEPTHKSPTPMSISPARRRVPTFSSPRRRISISDESPRPQEHGLGLGITKSPRRSGTRTDDVPSSQGPTKGHLFPSSAPNGSPTQKAKQPRQPSSALKKDSTSTSSKSQKRHSVSFADSEDGSAGTAAQKSKGSKLPESAPPSSQVSEIVWPPGFSEEMIREFQRKAELKYRNREENLNNPQTNAACQAILRDISRVNDEIKRTQARRPRNNLKKKLSVLQRRLEAEETKASAPEPSLPVTETTVARQIPKSEGRATSTASSRSFDGAEGTRRRSVSSSSSCQSGTSTTRGKSKSPNVSRERASPPARPANSPFDSYATRTQARNSSVVSASPPTDLPGKKPLRSSESPSVKEEESNDTENNLNTQKLSEPAMELDKDTGHAESDSGGDDSSESDDSSGSSESEDQEKENEHEQEKIEEETATDHQLNGGLEQGNAEMSADSDDSDISSDPDDLSESQDDENDGEDIRQEQTQEPTVNGDGEQVNGQTPHPNDLSDTDDSSELSDPGDTELENHKKEETDKKNAEDPQPHGSPKQANGQHPVKPSDQTPAKPAKPVEPSEDSSDSSEDSDEDSDESDSLALPRKMPIKPQPPAQPEGSSPPKSQTLASTKMPVLQRTTLKGLLQAQKAETQRRGQHQQQSKPQPPSGSGADIYEVPSSESSSEESDGDGDIAPSGVFGKMRLPYFGRK